MTDLDREIQRKFNSRPDYREAMLDHLSTTMKQVETTVQ